MEVRYKLKKKNKIYQTNSATRECFVLFIILPILKSLLSFPNTERVFLETNQDHLSQDTACL